MMGRLSSIGLGIIGCGHFGRYHAEAFARLRGVRLLAFCNRTLDKAQTLCNTFDGTLATTDPGDLMASRDVDAVVIATHHDSHAELCRQAVLAGKHVLVEKPLGITLKECEELAEAIRGHENRVAVGFKLRFAPTVQRARVLLPNPTLVIGQMVEDAWTSDMWPQNPRSGGGSVISGGCHTVDMLCFLAQSRPVRVAAEARAQTHPGHPCADQMHAIITFANGASGVCIQSQATTPARAGKYQFSLFNAAGVAIELYDRLQSGVYRIGARIEEVRRSGDEAIHHQASAFLAQARGAASACGLHEGLLANLLLEACLRAAKFGQAQTIHWSGDTPSLIG
jgi:predicted dehydrogenase